MHYRRKREGLPADGDLIRGECSVHAKLTEQDVHAMRQAYATGQVTLRELGDAFGVSNVSVYRAVSKKQWTHLD
jgi:predicted DNA binding protein